MKPGHSDDVAFASYSLSLRNLLTNFIYSLARYDSLWKHLLQKSEKSKLGIGEKKKKKQTAELHSDIHWFRIQALVANRSTHLYRMRIREPIGDDSTR